MFREILSRGIFYWLHAPRNYADFTREQRIMAGARLFLSLCLLTMFIFDKNLSSGAAGPQLLLYSVYSLLVCLATRLRVQSSPFFHIGIHCADILWAADLMLVIEWPGISFVLLFFLLISSKMRWGFWETQFTGAGFGFLSMAGIWICRGGIGRIFPRHGGERSVRKLLIK